MPDKKSLTKTNSRKIRNNEEAILKSHGGIIYPKI